MRPVFMSSVLVLIALGGTVRESSAQTRVPASAETPRAEVAVYGGLWNLEPSGPIGLGGRVGVNRSEWLGAEFSLEHKHADEYGPTQHAMIINARAMSPDPEGRAIAFVTIGAAAGQGTRHVLTPVFGAGLQSLWTGGLIALRGELQYFPRGLTRDREKTRVTIGIVLAIR